LEIGTSGTRIFNPLYSDNLLSDCMKGHTPVVAFLQG